MQQLSETSVDVLFVYGDPRYYGKFGFHVDAAERYVPPYRLRYPSGWQAVAFTAPRCEESSINISCVTSLCHPALW